MRTEASRARGRALSAKFIIEFINPRASVVLWIFGTSTLRFIAFTGEFASALFVLAYCATAFFIGFGLASGEDVSSFRNDLNWRSDDIGCEPGNAAAGHQNHYAHGKNSRHIMLRVTL